MVHNAHSVKAVRVTHELVAFVRKDVLTEDEMNLVTRSSLDEQSVVTVEDGDAAPNARYLYRTRHQDQLFQVAQMSDPTQGMVAGNVGMARGNLEYDRRYAEFRGHIRDDDYIGVPLNAEVLFESIPTDLVGTDTGEHRRAKFRNVSQRMQFCGFNSEGDLENESIDMCYAHWKHAFHSQTLSHMVNMLLRKIHQTRDESVDDGFMHDFFPKFVMKLLLITNEALKRLPDEAFPSVRSGGQFNSQCEMYGDLIDMCVGLKSVMHQKAEVIASDMAFFSDMQSKYEVSPGVMQSRDRVSFEADVKQMETERNNESKNKDQSAEDELVAIADGGQEAEKSVWDTLMSQFSAVEDEKIQQEEKRR